MKPLSLSLLYLSLLASALSSAEKSESSPAVAPIPDPIPGIVAVWSLSPTGRSSNLSAEVFLDGRSPTSIQWLAVTAEKGGLVDIGRYCKPIANASSKVWARATITSDRKEVRPLAFGYGDEVSVYLNGKILYHGSNGARQKDSAALDDISLNDIIYLPLEQGANELMLAVSAASARWGFMCRDMNAIYRDKNLRKCWEIPDTLSAPESAAYDPIRNVLYVSNFGADFISKISLDGEIIALKWISGLKGPTGLKMSGGKLYVVERSGVTEIDPEKAVITSRNAVPDAAFINDLCIDSAGTIYVTDTFKNCVFRISGGKAEVWIEGKALSGPNGILVEKDRLLVGVTSDSSIKAIDLKTKEITTFLSLDQGANMDGLVSDGKDGYLLSDYFGRIYHADASGRKTLLLDQKGPYLYTADFEYIPEKGLIIVPALFGKRLTAFSYHPDSP